MRGLLKVLILVGILGLLLPLSAFATNGDNMIGIGPASRSMGGVGIAAPQDAISAVFSNPAAMCFGPYCPGSEFNFAGTLFMPHVDAKITLSPVPPNPMMPTGLPGGTADVSSDFKIYGIPAIGLSVPITNTFPLWRFGIAAYGVSGLGVDYRNTDIDTAYDSFLMGPGSTAFDAFGDPPVIAGEYTQLQIMKFAPTVAFQPNEKLSLGLSVHIDYASLDLNSGSSFNYGIGAQIGALYKVNDMITLGATYTTPQEVNHQNVNDFDGDGVQDDLKLEAPQQFGLGAAFDIIPGKLLVEGDVKWINWEDATGYSDFDWKNQWVFAIGAQFKPIKNLAVRLGYNYGDNPLRVHDNFSGLDMATGMPTMSEVQGKMLPTYYYETFRIIGFPAIVQHHLTIGVGYELSNKFALHAGYMHAFEEKITEKGTTLFGQPVELESTLSEDSLEFGLTWRF